jgi:hypothetical protein
VTYDTTLTEGERDALALDLEAAHWHSPAADIRDGLSPEVVLSRLSRLATEDGEDTAEPAEIIDAHIEESADRRSPAGKPSGICIVCGHTTTDGNRSGGRWHWRCADGEECAVRRNRRRKRPRPEATVRAEWRQRQAQPPSSPSPNPHLKTTQFTPAKGHTQ